MPTIVRTFRVGDQFFMHALFPNEDDRIELHDQNGNTLLVYDANCNIFAEYGKVGDFRTEGDNWVSYHSSIRTRTVYPYTIHQAEGLLDAEVEFSKMWIAKESRKEAA